MLSYHSTQQRDSRRTLALDASKPKESNVLRVFPNHSHGTSSDLKKPYHPSREAFGVNALPYPDPNPPECQPPPLPPKRKRGAPGVQWNNSKERQFIRLYEMTDCRIEDIPVVMRDSELKFEKRHAQDKLSTLLNDQPQKYHPIGNEAQSRVEMSLGLKQAFKEKHGLQETQSNYTFAIEHDQHGFPLRHFVDSVKPEMASAPFDLDDPLLDELITPPRKSFGVLMDSFATQRTHAPYEVLGERSLGKDSDTNDNRTSLSSLQALEDRMAKRPTPKDGHQLMAYSSSALRTFLFVKKRLSIASLISKCSKTTYSSSSSQRLSWSTVDSSKTIAGSITTLSRRSSNATITSLEHLPKQLSTATTNSIAGFDDLNQLQELRTDTAAPPPVYGTAIPVFTDDEHSSLGQWYSPPTSLDSVPDYVEESAAREILGQASGNTQQSILGNEMILSNDNLAPRLLHDSNSSQNIVRDLEQGTGTSMDDDRLYVPQQDTVNHNELPFAPSSIANIASSKGLYNARMDSGWPLPSGSSLPTIKPSAANKIKICDKSPGPSAVKKNIKIRDKSGSCCMVTLRRGDPRASLCAACKLMEPDPHSFIRRTVKQWQRWTMADLDKMYRTSGFLEDDIHEVDMFHDTVLHAAACFGAGSEILLWLIEMGVDIHKVNAAGQTFMHVLKPTVFNGSQLDMLYDATEGFPTLLTALQEQGFNFSRRDDYGQTPLHVLTQYWLHSDSIAAAFNGMGLTAHTKPLCRDFRNRTINSQLFAQSNKEFDQIIDPHRRSRVGDFIQLDCPSLSVRSDPADRSKFLNLALSKDTIFSALDGDRQADFSGRNAIHCFVQYWFCESTFPALPTSDQPNKLKRKYPQRDLLALRAYNTRMIVNLCAAGIDINDYDIDGYTPLMVFIKNDTVEVVDRQTVTEACISLIQNGANVHRRNRKGETALHMAMALGRTAIVEVLLENHANKYSRTSHGKGILEVATKIGIRRGPDNSALYAKTLACINIAVRQGAVEGPDTKLEWDEQMKCSSLTDLALESKKKLLTT